MNNQGAVPLNAATDFVAEGNILQSKKFGFLEWLADRGKYPNFFVELVFYRQLGFFSEHLLLLDPQQETVDTSFPISSLAARRPALIIRLAGIVS